MNLRYLRFRIFGAVLDPFQTAMRRRRMRDFVRQMAPREMMSVLDVGGQPEIWRADELPPLDITILNLPGVAGRDEQRKHQLRYVEGDGCDSGFADDSFECVFSNSVIEHVGNAERRARFADEVRRVGCSYWVQTPAKGFPIEAHSGMPFWWFYPQRLRRHLLDRWHAKLPHWAEMVEGTTVLSKAELQQLFPEATIRTERLLGIAKSYVAVYVRPRAPDS